MKFDDEICKDVSCHECPFNKGEDGCLLANRLDEIEITQESCEEHTETHSCDYQRTGTHNWIPVTEALPRDDEEVIVTCLDDSGDTPYSYTTVAWHYKGMWVCDNTRCLFVIAWMPLPEPWREQE